MNDQLRKNRLHDSAIKLSRNENFSETGFFGLVYGLLKDDSIRERYVNISPFWIKQSPILFSQRLLISNVIYVKMLIL